MNNVRIEANQYDDDDDDVICGLHMDENKRLFFFQSAKKLKGGQL